MNLLAALAIGWAVLGLLGLLLAIASTPACDEHGHPYPPSPPADLLQAVALALLLGPIALWLSHE